MADEGDSAPRAGNSLLERTTRSYEHGGETYIIRPPQRSPPVLSASPSSTAERLLVRPIRSRGLPHARSASSFLKSRVENWRNSNEERP